MANGNLNLIAQALQGFGAGVAGRGQQFLQGQREADEQRRQALLMDNRVLLDHLTNQRFDSAQQLLANRVQNIDQLGGDPSDTVDMLQRLGSGDVAGVLAESKQVDQEAVTRGLLEPVGGETSADERNFNRLIKNLTPKEQEKARRIKLGLAPRAGISAAERIAADPSLTGQVAASGAAIEGAKEAEKLTQELAFKPKIQAAVKLAEEEARAQGETMTSLKRSRAALPGLVETVDILKELAPIATSTLGGKVFDAAVKESGFGATKGSTARAKFIAIVSNQVLPLLKETFGAAFTAAEGAELKATMGDPDASPAEKIAQLEAFIQQKQRSIQTKELEVSEQQPAPSGKQGGVLMTDAQGNRAFVFPDGSFEEVQ